MSIAKALVAVLMLAGVATAAPSRGDTLKVGASEAYKSPSAAAAVAKNGDHIEIEPGQYFDCAVWNANNLVIEGTDSGVVITDKTCNGMGLFVIWGNNITVRNLTLTRSRVPDMNGAGIRLVKGSLTVDTNLSTIKPVSSAAHRERRSRSATAILTRTAFAQGRARTLSMSRTSICCASRILTSLTLGRVI